MNDSASAPTTGTSVRAAKPRKFGRMKLQPTSVVRRRCRPGRWVPWCGPFGQLDLGLDPLAHLRDARVDGLVAGHDQFVLLGEDRVDVGGLLADRHLQHDLVGLERLLGGLVGAACRRPRSRRRGSASLLNDGHDADLRDRGGALRARGPGDELLGRVGVLGLLVDGEGGRRAERGDLAARSRPAAAARCPSRLGLAGLLVLQQRGDVPGAHRHHRGLPGREHRRRSVTFWLEAVPTAGWRRTSAGPAPSCTGPS